MKVKRATAVVTETALHTGHSVDIQPVGGNHAKWQKMLLKGKHIHEHTAAMFGKLNSKKCQPFSMLKLAEVGKASSEKQNTKLRH